MCITVKFENFNLFALDNRLAFIYCEMLNDASSAKQGSFYVTNTLDVASNCNPETGSTRIAGVSIYCSHCLGLLFCSFMQGNFFLSSFQFEKSYLKCITGQGPPPTTTVLHGKN